MEYVRGKDLNALMREKEQESGDPKIPIPLALFILYQVALGVHHAHTKKVIHRDIKPHNILLSSTGDVKIVDFGIARKINADEAITENGTVVGTPAYMSPEQFSSKNELTIRTDIYSLGVVFYEMITGIKPFKNEYSHEVLSAISNGKFIPPTKLVKNIPFFVRKILKKTFNANIKKRYKTLIPLIKSIRKYFSSYNIFEIKDSVRRLVLKDKNLDNSPFFIRYKKKSINRIRATFSFWICIVVIILVTLFFTTNRQYEWLGKNSYGKVIFEFNRVNMDPNNIYISVDKRTEKAKVKKERFSKVYYLKKGEHKFTVTSGSYINSRFFYILPISTQKKVSNIFNGQICEIPISQLWQQEVTVYFRFWDSINNSKNLLLFDNYSSHNIEKVKSEKDNLRIKYKGSYINLKDYIYNERTKFKRAPFYSGTTYFFKIENIKEGKNRYLDKDFSVKFELEERSVVYHNTMTLAPAKIEISTTKKRLPIYINNNIFCRYYEDGNYKVKHLYDIKYKKIDKNNYTTVILIPPGDYDFKISKDGLSKKIKLNSDDLIKFNVTKEDGSFKY